MMIRKLVALAGKLDATDIDVIIVSGATGVAPSKAPVENVPAETALDGAGQAPDPTGARHFVVAPFVS
jgi:molybdopterin biosynthesis enzyme MoaB